MKRVGKVLATMVILLFLTLVLAVVALRYAGQERYQDWLTYAVERVTQRDLQIDGDFSFSPTLEPTLIAENVSLSNADWGTQPALFAAKRVEAMLDLKPLLRGDIVLKDVNLDGAKLFLETDEEGRKNWKFNPDKPPHEIFYPVHVDQATIKDSLVSYFSGDSGKTQEYFLTDVEASTDPESDIVTAQVLGEHRGFPVAIEGTLGRLKTFFDKQPTEVALQAKTGEVAWQIKGVAEQLLRAKGIDLLLDGKAQRFTDTNILSRKQLPELGPVTARARLVGNAPIFHLHDLTAFLEQEERKAIINGSIEDLGKKNRLQLEFMARDPALNELLSLFNVDFPLPANANASGALVGEPASLGLENVDLQIEGEDVNAVFQGNMARLRKPLDMAFTTQVSAPSLAVFSNLIKRELPDAGPVKATAQVNFADQVWSVNNLDALIDGPELFVQANGAIGNAGNFSNAKLDVDVKASRVEELGRILNKKIPVLGAFALHGTLRGQGKSLLAEDTEITLKGEEVQLQAKGGIRDLLNIRGINADIQAETPSLANLLTLLDIESKAAGAMEVSAKIRPDEQNADRLEATIKGVDFDLTADTVVMDWRALDKIQSQFQLQAASLNELSRIIGKKLPGIKDLQATGSIQPGAEKTLQISSALDGANFKATVEGEIGMATEIPTQLDIDIRAAKLSDLDDLASNRFPSVGPFQGTTRLSKQGQKLQLDEMILSLKDIAATGHLQIDLASTDDARSVAGHLQFGNLNLNTWFGDGSDTTSDKEPGNARVFPDSPLPLDFIDKFDFNITVGADRLTRKKWRLQNMEGILTTRDGRLTFPFSADIKPGSMTGSLDIKNTGAKPQMVFSFAAESLDPSRIAALENQALMQRGDIDIDIDISGTGKSLHQIMASADGRFRLTVNDGRLSQKALRLFGADILSQVTKAINPFRRPEEFFDLQCGFIGFDINDGLARSENAIGMQSEDVAVIGSGYINLDSEKLEVVLTPKAREGLGVSVSSLAKLVALGGHLAKPKVEIDPAGLLESGAFIGAAVASGGLSLLVQGLFDRLTTSQSVCDQASGNLIEQTAEVREVETAKKESPKHKSSKQKLPGEASEDERK